MQTLRQFIVLTSMEFRIFLREPVAVFFNLCFPLLFFFLTMHVFLSEESIANGAVNHFIPSFIVILTTGVSIFNIPIYIVRYRNIKFLKRLTITPTNPAVILASLAIANLLILILGLIVIIGLGIGFYGAEFTGNWLVLIGVCILVFFSISSLGWILSATITGVRTINVVGQLVYYPLLFLSSAVPMDLGSAAFLQKLIPTTYAVDVVKHAWNPEFFNASANYPYFIGNFYLSILVLIGVALAAFGISYKLFKWE